MKKIFYLFMLTLIGLSLQGQSDFLKKEKVWSVLYMDGSRAPGHMKDTKETQWFRIIGDTLLDNILYKKINLYKDSLFQNIIFTSFMRVDSINRVLCKYYTDQTEFLWYDFNMKQGDTARMVLERVFDYQLKIKVDSIKTIEIQNKIRKILFLTKTCIIEGIDGFTNSDVWIEDVGSMSGLFTYPICSVGPLYNYQLLCVHDNGSLIYQNPAFNSCYIKDPPDNPIGINMNAPTREVKLTFENHTLKINITGYQDDKVDCHIYNLLGSLVYTNSFKNTGVLVSFNLAHLPVGIYVVQIVQNKQVIKNFKISR